MNIDTHYSTAGKEYTKYIKYVQIHVVWGGGRHYDGMGTNDKRNACIVYWHACMCVRVCARVFIQVREQS